MKWFPHIAKVLEISRQVKAYDPSIRVVVGGNSASYYWEKIIRYDTIDYVVRGDGELPLRKICNGEENIPNCVYRKDKKIITTPISYVQDRQNSEDIFLSHLDEVFVSPLDPYLSYPLFINIGKGCTMNDNLGSKILDTFEDVLSVTDISIWKINQGKSLIPQPFLQSHP